MLPEEDNWIIRSIRQRVATWSSRTETARQMGDDQLLRKALKYKARYETQLAEFLQLEAECDQREQQESKLDSENEQVCRWCTLFKDLPECMGNYDFMQSSEIISDAIAAMGITVADLEKMEEGYASGSKETVACDECRAQHSKNLAMLTRMRQVAQEGSKKT